MFLEQQDFITKCKSSASRLELLQLNALASIDHFTYTSRLSYTIKNDGKNVERDLIMSLLIRDTPEVTSSLHSYLTFCAEYFLRTGSSQQVILTSTPNGPEYKYGNVTFTKNVL